MKKLVYILTLVGLSVLVAFVLIGFFQNIDPLFDSFSHFRIHFLVTMLLLLSFLFILKNGKMRYFTTSFIVVIIVYLYSLIGTFNTVPTIQYRQNIKMMQYNLRFDNKNMDKVQKFLINNPVDIATFQEVTLAHKEKLEALKPQYPYQEYCQFMSVGGTMILSKFPFTDKGNCLQGDGLVWREVDAQGKKISLVSLHLHWPYPHGQYEQVTLLSKELARIHSSKVIAGDFNAAPWSHTVERIATASNTDIVDGVRWSIRVDTPVMGVWLPIDHILVSDDLIVNEIKAGENLGSDHLPMLTTIHVK